MAKLMIDLDKIYYLKLVKIKKLDRKSKGQIDVTTSRFLQGFFLKTKENEFVHICSGTKYPILGNVLTFDLSTGMIVVAKESVKKFNDVFGELSKKITDKKLSVADLEAIEIKINERATAKTKPEQEPVK